MGKNASTASVLATARESIGKSPWLAAGFTLYWVWVVITLQGPIRFPLQTALGFPLPSWCITLLCATAMGVIIAVRAKNYRRFAARKKFCYLRICLLMFIGLALSTLWVALSTYPAIAEQGFVTALYLAGSVFMGAGSVAVFVEFCRFYVRLGVRTMLYHGALAMTAAMVYQAIFLVLQLPELNLLINPFFPVGIYFSFVKSTRSLPAAAETNPQHLRKETISKVLVTALVQGIAFGLGLGMLLHWSDLTAEPRLVGSLCSGVAAALILFTATKLQSNFTSMIYLVGFPLMALGFLIMAASSQLLWVGNAVLATGSCFQYVVISCLFVYLARARQYYIETVAGFGVAALYLGQVIGGCVGSLLTDNFLSFFTFETIASSTCVLLLMLALYISNSNRLSRGWEEARPDGADDAVEGRIRALAAEAGLTSRQEEILGLLALGRNKNTIARDLHISEETAKTHIRNIYGKIAVHSQQELIDLIRRQET